MSTCKAGMDIYQQLQDAGIELPSNVRRIVIDISVDEAVKVYYETFASSKTMDVVIESLIRNKDHIDIVEVKGTGGG